jgi:hypothetical protein
MMHARLCIAVVAVLALGGAAEAACVPGQAQGCINLDLLPQVSQQIVGGPYIPGTAKPAAKIAPSQPYNGPIVGLSPTVRPTPTVGYRWSFD